MKLIGITGLMGSGKTIISNMFGFLGAIVYNTDNIAQAVQIKNKKLKNKLIKKFGEQYFLSNGKLNKPYISCLIFENNSEAKKNIAWINKNVGKYVIEHLKEYKASLEAKNTPCYILIESAILFESGLNKLCDKTICVKSPNAAYAAINRDGITREEWQLRMITQLPDDKKNYDYIIANDYTTNVETQVEKIHKELTELM